MHVEPDAARALIAAADFRWYQRFPLAEGVDTPGVRDVAAALQLCDLPSSVAGRSVLDIGTSNGGVAFDMERRGAARVVAVDIFPPTTFGFAQVSTLLGSRVEFVQARVYELPEILSGTFDLVFFLGVLYHLRHPLLALDCVRTLTAGRAYIETEVADNEVGELRPVSLARYYRNDQRAADPTNWFAPTIACLMEWCHSSGLEPELLAAWPAPLPQRCLVRASPTTAAPEYLRISYERPVHAQLTGARPAAEVAKPG